MVICGGLLMARTVIMAVAEALKADVVLPGGAPPKLPLSETSMVRNDDPCQLFGGVYRTPLPRTSRRE